MRRNFKLTRLILLCVLLASSVFTCEKKSTKDKKQDVIGDAIGLYRLTLSGAPTKIGLVTIPFLKDDRQFRFLSVTCDFNGDGEIAGYSVVGGTQEELVVGDMPLRITQTAYSFYFSLVDTSISLGRKVKAKVLASQGTFYPPGSAGKTPPLTRVSLEKTVDVQILDMENNANPEEGYIDTGDAHNRLRVRSGNSQSPPRDDINETSFFIARICRMRHRDRIAVFPIPWLTR